MRRSGSAGTQSQRQRRVGELIRGALSDALARGEFRDPVLSEVRLTVTEVRPSPDLRAARVYVMPLGGEREEEALAALERAAGYLRGEVNRRVSLKFSPALRFEIDRSFAHVRRIDGLLGGGRGGGVGGAGD